MANQATQQAVRNRGIDKFRTAVITIRNSWLLSQDPILSDSDVTT